MDWITGIQQAIDYMERNLLEEIDYEEIAKHGFSSAYHFCRVFGILCGYTPGEYLRKRRLSQAGEDILNTEDKIIDIALRYGYESPDSFTKAFSQFHGTTPAQARKEGRRLRRFSRMTLKLSFAGGDSPAIDSFRMERKDAFTLVGRKLRCQGAPSDEMYRKKQMHDFMVDGEVRFARYALQAMAKSCSVEYGAIFDVDDEGYSFVIGSVIPTYFVNHLEKTVGRDNAKRLTVLPVPACTYAILETERGIRSFNDYVGLRRKLMTELLPPEYKIACSPEILVFHLNHENKNESYIEQWIPVE